MTDRARSVLMQGSTLNGGLKSFSSPRPTTNTAGGRTKYAVLPVWHRGARGSTQHSGGTEMQEVRRVR